MRKIGGGIGLVVLVVVMAVVLLLVAKSWKRVAPTAIQVTNPGLGQQVDDRGETEAGESIRSGQLPNLDEMRENTSEHADRLEEALKEIE